MTKDARQTEIDQNLEAFLKELPKLAAQQGKFALIRHRKIEHYFETPMDALSAGNALFPDNLFSVQQVTDVATDLGFYSHAVSVVNAQ